MMKDKLEQLKRADASISKEFKTAKLAKANIEDPASIDLVYNVVDSAHRRIDNLANTIYDYMYEHSKGHMPPVRTASGMQKLLDAAGMGDDYEVLKPFVSVASTKKGILGNMEMPAFSKTKK